MEYCEGGALSDVLANKDVALSLVARLRFCSELASGMAYLHSDQIAIVHGDLKAQNLLLFRPEGCDLKDYQAMMVSNKDKVD